jgi:hypothetical protein
MHLMPVAVRHDTIELFVDRGAALRWCWTTGTTNTPYVSAARLSRYWRMRDTYPKAAQP